MIAVIFEAWLSPGLEAEYLDLAAKLFPQLEKMEGFISIERFRSVKDPEKLLSLSFWKDETSVAAWRKAESHRAAQARGRDVIFKDYRLRIAAVVRDYGMFERQDVPLDEIERVIPSTSSHSGAKTALHPSKKTLC